MRVTAWHLDSTTKAPQEPFWAALSGACPDCRRGIVAHLEGRRLCLVCGWSDLPGELPAPCDPQEPMQKNNSGRTGSKPMWQGSFPICNATDSRGACN